MSTKKQGQRTNRERAFDKIENMHPHKMFLLFATIGSALVFLSLVFLYAVRIIDIKVIAGLSFPKVFSISTVVILISSYTLTRCVSAFKYDNMNQLRVSLFLTFSLSLIFCFMQVIAIRQLYNAGLYINDQPGVVFLYVLTGFHLAHVILGFVALAYLNFNVSIAANDMVKQLLFFSSKREKNKLEIVSFYWHYVDAVWLVLYFLFLFSI